jgi:hypothetical protein
VPPAIIAGQAQNVYSIDWTHHLTEFLKNRELNSPREEPTIGANLLNDAAAS